MILRLLAASLRRRFRQTAVILVAVTVAAGTVAALVGVSRRAAGGFDQDLAAFGPNLMVRPQVGGPAVLPPEDAEILEAVPGVVQVTAIPVATPTGETGGVERFELRVDRERLDAVAAEVEARIAGAEATPVLQVSRSETELARRLTLLLAAVALVACLLALLSVSASTTALVEERRREIGLFVALGFTPPRVGVIFAAELLAVALVAGLAGNALGELAAGRLVTSVLDSTARNASPEVFGLVGLAASAAAAVLVVGLSMTLALARIGRLDAAQVLRGE